MVMYPIIIKLHLSITFEASAMTIFSYYVTNQKTTFT